MDILPSYRVIKSGHIVEVYRYQATVLRKDDDLFRSDKGGRHNEGVEERKEEYRGTVNQRARNTLRRLINANFDNTSLFITLTYEENMKEVDKGTYDFKKFVQKMKRRQKDFQYVAVIEFQKRGAVHFHMLCNYRIEWNNHKELQTHERDLGKVWGHGFVDIGYKQNDNAGAYLIKYMTKENNDVRLQGKKRYFYSRSLEKPKELVGYEAVQIIKELEDMPAVFTNEYYSDFHGQVKYSEYNPKRYDYETYKRVVNEKEIQWLIDTNIILNEIGVNVEYAD